MDNRDRRIDDRERVDFVVVALFFLPVLGALAIVSVKILEIALNRPIASSFDVLRTVVAIAGIGAATVVAGFLTLLVGTGENGPASAGSSRVGSSSPWQPAKACGSC